MATFGIVTGVALAQDSPELQQQADTSTTAEERAPDPTTTNDPTTDADPTTTDSDPTTTDSDPTTTDSDDGTTTTESSEVIAPQAAQIRAVTTSTQGSATVVRCDPEGPKIDPPLPGTTEKVVGTVTFTFTFNNPVDGTTTTGEPTEGTWTSSAPFTGQIIVKSANNYQVIELTNATTGAVTGFVETTTQVAGPNTRTRTITHAISHLEFCDEGSTTTTGTTSTGTTTTGTTTTGTTTTGTTTTGTTTTDTTTTDTTTTDTTTTGTTTTGTTTTGTTPVAGTTAAGGGGVAGTKGGGGGGGGAAGSAAEGARAGGGGLPFTGLHVPLLILLGLGTAGAGIALNRKLANSA